MELRDYFRGLRRHWLAIVLMTALGLAVGYGWTLLQTPVYQASASGLVQARDTGDVGMASVADSAARARVASYMDIATWQSVAQRAIDQLGLSSTPEQVITQITITNTPDTAIIGITAQAGSPEEARGLAEAWIASLAVEIDGIEGTGEVGSAAFTIVQGNQAALPTSPIFPDVQTAIIVGGILGLGFGIAFAMTRTVSDRRVRATDDVEAKTGLALVGAIPVSEGLEGDERLIGAATQKGKAGFAVAEAMRSLRTNLQFMDVDNPPRTIVVTSPLPGDGKSTIASNLALTLAAGGRPVVLVDGDLRRSAVAKTMNLPGGAGLTDVLSGRAELSEVLQRTPLAQSMFVLTAGSVPPNPSEVLGSDRMRTLLKDLAAHATVIVDAPPLLPVTDGAILTHQADGALLVVSLGKTTYDLVDKAVDTLRKASGRPLGIVLNRVPLRGVDASPYSYEYRREYGAPQASAEDAAPSDSAEDFDLDGIFTPAEAPSGKGRQRARRG